MAPKTSRRSSRRKKTKVNDNPIEFSSNGDHAGELLEQLNLQRQEGELCDVVLVVNGRKFPAHRNVLSACCMYFKSMFSGSRFAESRQKEVKLRSLNPSAVETLLDYMYTDRITISVSNVEDIIAASDLFLMQKVREYCAEYWTKTLGVDNVLTAYRNADTYNLDNLRNEAETYLSKNFSSIVESSGFVSFPKEVVIVMIKSDFIEVEEIDTFFAVMKWVNHNVDERKQHLDELMSYVRLPLMPAHDLIGYVQKDPLVSASEWCKELIQEAMGYQLLPEKHGEQQNQRTRPRYGNRDEVIFAVGTTGTEGDDLPDKWLTKCYVPRLNMWYSLASLNANSVQGLAYCKEFVFCLCYNFSSEQMDLYKYDIVTNAWSECAPVSRTMHVIRNQVPNGDTWVQLVTCEEKLYMFSSVLNSQTNLVQSMSVRYDPNTNKWDQLPDMEVGRLFFSAVAKGSFVYIIGGKVSDGDSTVEVECLDVVRETWTFRKEMQLARHSMNICFAMSDGTILVSDYECRDPDVYDPENDMWTSFEHEIELAESLPVFFTDCPGGNEMNSVFTTATNSLYATCEASFDENLAAWYRFHMEERKWVPCASMPQLIMPFLCAVK